jgi:predicted CopG family antitoxin
MSKPGIRLDDDIYRWLFDHRSTKEKTMSEVIRGLIAFKEGRNLPNHVKVAPRSDYEPRNIIPRKRMHED